MTKEDKLNKQADMEFQIDKKLMELANYVYKHKLGDGVGPAMLFGTLGKDPYDFSDKKGKLKKNKRYFRIKYEIEFLDKVPKSYLRK